MGFVYSESWLENFSIAPSLETNDFQQPPISGKSEVLKSYSKPRPSVLNDLTDSFFNQTKVEIDYSSATNEKTTRLIEPQVLCLVFPVWYFLCWDELRQSERLFRIDRILSTKKTNKVFKRRRKGKLIEGAKELFASI